MCTSGTQHTPNVLCKSSKRKIDFSILPVSPTSPILNTRRNRSISTLSEKSSPVLRSRKKKQNYSKTSPILHTNKEIIKLGLESNSKYNCVRKLQYETQELIRDDAHEDILLNIQSVEKSDSLNKKFTLNFKSEHIKEPLENKPITDSSIFKDNFNHKKRKRKKNYRNYQKKITYDDDNDEKIEIETVCSQEIANNIENSIIGKLESPRSILKNVSINKWNLKLIEENLENNIELISSQKSEEHEIEIINSQIINKPSKIFAEKFQPREEIIEEASQNSYTQRSSILKTQNIIEESQSSSSALSNISNCTVVQDSFEKSSEEYIWSPIKKKKYKPGTYSHKFQRILRKQKANTAIWKHEMYLAKSTNYEIPASEEDSKITIVEIRKINTDYGMNIIECVEVHSEEKCLIVVDFRQFDIDIIINDLIKIFPPFLVQYLKVDQCDIKTFVNVHKVLKCS